MRLTLLHSPVLRELSGVDLSDSSLKAYSPDSLRLTPEAHPVKQSFSWGHLSKQPMVLSASTSAEVVRRAETKNKLFKDLKQTAGSDCDPNMGNDADTLKPIWAIC